jgi:hypothetical protein
VTAQARPPLGLAIFAGVKEKLAKSAAVAALLLSVVGCSAEPQPAAPAGSASAGGSSGSLPDATDGTGYGACADGRCRVLVTEPVDVVVGPEEFAITLDAETVTLTRARSNGPHATTRVGADGSAVWGTVSSAPAVQLTVLAVNADGAVLDFRMTD